MLAYFPDSLTENFSCITIKSFHPWNAKCGKIWNRVDKIIFEE